MNSFVFSYYISVFVQFIAFFIQIYGVFLHVTPELIPLKYALNIEVCVSIIEFIVYLWIGTNLKNLDVVMTKRYADWVITTNGLMISISLLFIYLNQQELHYQEQPEENNKETLIVDNTRKFIPLIVYNNLMLLCGFMGEKGVLSKKYSFSLGFFFFFLGFYSLFQGFAIHSRKSTKVFYIITTIWAMYGFSHILPKIEKNVAYNILDLISKNLFGVFMVYLILNPQTLTTMRS